MPARSSGALLVLVAVPSPSVARRISAALLDRRLCAGVQVLGPVTSRYRWKGKLERAREWLLLGKTRQAHFPAIERTVRALHPYEVPEIAGAPLDRVHAPYLEWLAAETGARPGPGDPAREGRSPPRRASRARRPRSA